MGYNGHVNDYIPKNSQGFEKKEECLMNFSVALQVYSVRDFAEKDLEGTLQKIKEMGYDGRCV